MHATTSRGWPQERPKIAPLARECRAAPAREATALLRELEGVRWAVLDFETAAFLEPRVVEVGLVDQDGHVLVDELVDPGIPMAAEVVAIHGIEDSDVRGCAWWPEVQAKLAAALSEIDVVVAFSARFEAMCLDYNAALWGLPPLRPRFICAQQIASGLVGLNEEGRWLSLRTACARVGIPHDRAHRAVEDCRVTAQLLSTLHPQAEHIPAQAPAPTTVVDQTTVSLHRR